VYYGSGTENTCAQYAGGSSGTTWNKLTTAILNIPCRIKNPTVSIDAYLFEEQSGRVLAQSDLKWRDQRLLLEMTSWPPSWKYDVMSKIQVHQSMLIYSKNNPAKVHPDLIWNDGAFGISRRWWPNTKKWIACSWYNNSSYSSWYNNNDKQSKSWVGTFKSGTTVNETVTKVSGSIVGTNTS